MPGHNRPRPTESRWAQALFALVAVTPVVLFLYSALRRIAYPFPLEQLEGPMLLAAERVAHGLPVYVRPNFHFIPYMYAPAYFYVSGWAVRLLGPGFLPLRLVSLLSTCGTFVLLYSFILLETKGSRRRRHLAALAGVGLYATAYPWTRQWFDLGRVDSLYIVLLLIALLCTRLSGMPEKRLHPIVAAAAWTLAFLAKQTILPVALVLLCHDWKRPRRTLLGVGSFLLMVAIVTALLNRATHGWFWFYAFTVPHANSDLLLRPAVFYISSLLLAPFGVALLIVAVSACLARPWHNRPAARFYLLAAASTFGLCWFLQAHGGATANTPMPAYAVLAILFGIGIARLDAWCVAHAMEQARIFLLIAAAVPLATWIYNPHDIIPQRPAIAADNQLLSWLQSFPGDVFLPANPYEGVLAGKPWHPDIAALHDALRPDRPEIRQPLLAEIRSEIDGETFDAIALDGPPGPALAGQPWLPGDLQQHYPIVGLVPGGSAWVPFTPHPAYFLLPCRERALAVQKGWTLLQTPGHAGCGA